MRLPATLDAFATEPVTFLHARRQKERRRGTIGAEHFAEQRERGDPIDVVIAVEDNLFPARDRVQDPIDGGAHLWEQERIASSGANAAGGTLPPVHHQQVLIPAKERATQGRAQDLRSKNSEPGMNPSGGGQDPASCPFHFCNFVSSEDGRVEDHQTSLSAAAAAGSNCCCAHNSPNRLKPAFSARQR